MQRKCDSCGKPYEAKRKTSRFCSTRCRQRNHQGRSAPTKKAKSKPTRKAKADAPAPSTDRGLVDSVRTELDRAGQLASALGQQALVLAEKICNPFETGSGVASASKELRAVMAELRKDVKPVADPVDELRQRRDRKRTG